jgi:hypothetical protein
LSTYVCLGLLNGIFPSGFPTNILYAFLFTPIHGTCPTHLILIDLISTDYDMRCHYYNWLLKNIVFTRIFATNELQRKETRRNQIWEVIHLVHPLAVILKWEVWEQIVVNIEHSKSRWSACGF